MDENDEKNVVEFEEGDVVVVAPHWYPCLDNQLRPGVGGKYLVRFKFNSGNFFGDPVDRPGYQHVVAAEHIRWKAE